MAMSGVELRNECQEAYQGIQKDKTHKYAIFKIDGGQILLDKTGNRDSTYDAFLEDLQVKNGEYDDCRYAVYDYEYIQQVQGTEPSQRSKLILFSWCPDTANVKAKMIYSSSLSTLKKAFVGVHKVVQANGVDELEQSYVENLLKSMDRK